MSLNAHLEQTKANTNQVHKIMLMPVGFDVELTNVAKGLFHSCQERNIKVAHFKAISQAIENCEAKQNATSLALHYVEEKIAKGENDIVLEQIVANFESFSQDKDLIIIEGLTPSTKHPYIDSINRDLAQALGADIVLVTSSEGDLSSDFETRLSVCAQSYGGQKNTHLIGTIINKVNLSNEPLVAWQKLAIFNHQGFDLLGVIPASNTDDLAKKDIDTAQIVATNLSTQWLTHLATKPQENLLLSPPAFRHKLTALAKQANKLVVLPEGNDIRTIKAAAICCERQIARCQLIGNKAEILEIAKQESIDLPDNLLITEPETIRKNYVEPLVALRKSKGLTPEQAITMLQDNVMLSTMMLQQGQVDGLVSGAVNTTANTIRPALQLIKTAPGSSLVSSVFFMLLPDQVLVYGDCAINPDPSAEQLADIAIQSADSAAAFGIEPRVAMISYSTGSSGQGSAVEKVIEATKIAQQKRPDLMIDGPLQYDAAIMENVAKKKAPNSPVAGKATVFIFPDLNTGNTTYKAVQRTADLVSIGPMLQGMNKPVNDLSRGALVDDIVYTIALTAIQATQ